MLYEVITLITVNMNRFYQNKINPARPTQVQTISDRNNNTMVFEYEDMSVSPGQTRPVLKKA